MASNINIMVVDDDPVILRSAWRSLTPEGYTVEGALNGKEALRRMEQINYDLVFIDLTMPEMDGISLIRWIRQFRPATGIVVITGHLLQETIKEAHGLGISCHMMKPFTPEVLRDIAKKTIERLKGHAGGNGAEEDFPPQMLAELDKVINQYRKGAGSTILVLLHAQEIFGYLPPVIQERIARGLNIYPSEINSIVSFYPCFRTRPREEHTACYIKGSERVWKGIIPKTGKRVTDAVNEYIRLRHPATDETEEATGRADAFGKAAKKEISASRFAELDEVIHQYRDVPGSATPVLLRAQEIFGYLPLAVQERIALGLNIYPSEIRSLVSLHPFFRTKPEGDNTIRVCLGAACYLGGSEKVLRRIKNELNIGVGETTKDRKFTLETVKCNGTCGIAPRMYIEQPEDDELTDGETTSFNADYSPANVSPLFNEGENATGKEA